MKAVQLAAWQSEPEIRDVPVPEPGAGQVLLRVAGAGACHSDLPLMEWPPGTLPYPLPFYVGSRNRRLGGGRRGGRDDGPAR